MVPADRTQDLCSWPGRRRGWAGLPAREMLREASHGGAGGQVTSRIPFWLCCVITAHFRTGVHGAGRAWELEGKGWGSQERLVSNACPFILHLQKKPPTLCPIPQKTVSFYKHLKIKTK